MCTERFQSACNVNKKKSPTACQICFGLSRILLIIALTKFGGS